MNTTRKDKVLWTFTTEDGRLRQVVECLECKGSGSSTYKVIGGDLAEGSCSACDGLGQVLRAVSFVEEAHPNEMALEVWEVQDLPENTTKDECRACGQDVGHLDEVFPPVL